MGDKESITGPTPGNLRRCRYADIFGRPVGEGWFHGWGLSAYNNHGGPVSYSVAIIEKDDGTVIQALPHNVTFLKEGTK